MPRSCFAHAQDDLNLSILCMFEGTFSLDAAQSIFKGIHLVNVSLREMTFGTPFAFLHTRSLLLWRRPLFKRQITLKELPPFPPISLKSLEERQSYKEDDLFAIMEEGPFTHQCLPC